MIPFMQIVVPIQSRSALRMLSQCCSPFSRLLLQGCGIEWVKGLFLLGFAGNFWPQKHNFGCEIKKGKPIIFV